MRLYALRVKGTTNVVIVGRREVKGGIEHTTFVPVSEGSLNDYTQPHWLAPYEVYDLNKWPKVMEHWMSKVVIPTENLEVAAYELTCLGVRGNGE